jgi:hypothetical protein
MTQLKLFTWVHGPTGWHGWLALNSSMELAPTVVSGRWFHSRTVPKVMLTSRALLSNDNHILKWRVK